MVSRILLWFGEPFNEPLAIAADMVFAFHAPSGVEYSPGCAQISPWPFQRPEQGVDDVAQPGVGGGDAPGIQARWSCPGWA